MCVCVSGGGGVSGIHILKKEGGELLCIIIGKSCSMFESICDQSSY